MSKNRSKNNRFKKSTAEIHHVVPVSEGGQTTRENGQVVCRHCHVLIHQRLDSSTATLKKGEIKNGRK